MARIWGLERQFRFPWRTRKQIRNEISEELDFHLACRTQELEASGLEPRDARAEAIRRFGDLERTRSLLELHGRRSERRRQRTMVIEETLRDLRLATRSLLRTPGFAMTAVVVLAIGIGVNAAMFGLVDLLLMRPRLIVEPERMLGIFDVNVERPDTSGRSISYPNYADIRAAARSFSDIAGISITVVGSRGDGGQQTARTMAGLVSSNFLRTFGVQPVMGRDFSAEEELPSTDPVLILSHEYWQSHGAREDIVGSTLAINGIAATVIGVAPPGFTGSTAIFAPSLWLPLGMFDALQSGFMGQQGRLLAERDNGTLMVMGRLADGVSRQQALAELQTIAAGLEETYPAVNEKQTLTVAPLRRLGMSTSPGDDRFLLAPAVLMMAMTAVVLLIACLNLANMFLARCSSRRTEIAIRSSLGSGRGRLLRQLFAEGILLALLGGVAGLALAYASSRLLFSTVSGLLPFGVSLSLDATPDLRIVAVTLLFSLLAAALFGLAPAYRLTRGDVFQSLREGAADPVAQRARRGGGGPSRRTFSARNLSLAGQIALSLTLVVAGGLFVRGALRAAKATPGFSLDRSLLVELDTSLVGYDETRTRTTYAALLERLRALPGVAAVSMADIVPFGAVTRTWSVRTPGSEVPLDDLLAANTAVVTNDYFRSLGLPILAGRDFTLAEMSPPAPAAGGEDAAATTAEREQIAIVSAPLAERLWPGESAVGRTLEVPASNPASRTRTYRVVGVVPGIKHSFTDREPVAHLYLPYGQQFTSNVNVHVRLFDAMGESESAALGTLRREIMALDPQLPIVGLKTMRDHRDQSLFVWLVESGARVFAVLGVLALFLALVGIYGVRSFLMSRRTREIGLRMALGATRWTVLRQMLRESLALTVLGLGAGVLLSLAAGRLLAGLLFEVSGFDPLVLVSATVLLGAAATLAAYVPARRATRIEPIVALRQE